jgi:hypothetical protein
VLRARSAIIAEFWRSNISDIPHHFQREAIRTS